MFICPASVCCFCTVIRLQDRIDTELEGEQYRYRLGPRENPEWQTVLVLAPSITRVVLE